MVVDGCNVVCRSVYDGFSDVNVCLWCMYMIHKGLQSVTKCWIMSEWVGECSGEIGKGHL